MSTGELTETTPSAPEDSPPDPSPVAPRRALLFLFSVVAVVMTFPHVSRLSTYVPGDYGDAMFNLWILRWVAHAAPEGFTRVWDTNVFHPLDNTLAWSDPLFALVPVHWAFERLTGSIALAFNLVYLLGWTLSMWFTYRLSLHFTGRHGPSVVAALAFTFAAPRLSHTGHWQLSATGWMVPLILLLAVRYCRRPRLLGGVVLGLALAALTVTSSYYGVMMALTTGLVLAGFAVFGRPRPLGRYLAGLLAGAGVALVVVAPVALHYQELLEDPYFTREPEPMFSAYLDDFLAPDQEAYLLPQLPPFESRAFNRSVENRLFPGIVALAFGTVGIVVLLRSRQLGTNRRSKVGRQVSGRLDRKGVTVLLLVVGAGLVMLVLAFGRYKEVFGHQVTMPYRVLETVVPGLEAIRATARFVIVAQCVLAVLASLGLVQLLRRARPRTAVLASIAVSLAVLAESAVSPDAVRLPDQPRFVAVNQALAARSPGVVVELPMGNPSDGPLWAFIEAPRSFLSTWDWNERVNGLSGYAPPGFEAVAQDLESFPSPAAFDRIDEFDIRYVVLRTEPVGDLSPEASDVLGQDGVASYAPPTVNAKLAGVPKQRLASVERFGEAYLVEIRPVAPS